MSDLIKKYGPFKCNVTNIARGVIELIDEHPDGKCLSLGMLPADLMESLSRKIADKIPDNYHWENDPKHVYVYDDGAYIRTRIEHFVTCEILRIATETKRCLV